MSLSAHYGHRPSTYLKCYRATHRKSECKKNSQPSLISNPWYQPNSQYAKEPHQLKHLPLETIEDVAAPNIPLLATSRQRTRAVNKSTLINTKHAHLSHRGNESSIPCTFAERESVEGKHSDRVLSDALV